MYRTKKEIRKEQTKARKRKKASYKYYLDNKDRLQREAKVKNAEYRKPIESTIYLITNDAWSGFVKVGRAKDVDKRLDSYQTSSPFRDYEVKFSLKVDDVYLAEKLIYNKYEMLNEWTRAEWKSIKNDLIEFNNK